MIASMNVLKAQHVGVRDLKENISVQYLQDILVITDRGVPLSVNVPYSDILELLDILEEMSDPAAVKLVHESRQAVDGGAKVRPASKVFERIRKGRRQE